MCKDHKKKLASFVLGRVPTKTKCVRYVTEKGTTIFLKKICIFDDVGVDLIK